MKDNESSSQPLAHETVQSHHTLISVMFGVALGFWVNTLHAYEFKNLNVPLGITILLTFAVIICVYWWYIHLCSHYPSHTLVQYSIDFMIVIGLCIMSMACGEKTQFKWTISWGFLAVLASLKVWLCPGEVAQLLDKRLVWAPRVGAPIILIFAVYAAVLAYKHDTPSILITVLAAVPVLIGIIITCVVAHNVARDNTMPNKAIDSDKK